MRVEALVLDGQHRLLHALAGSSTSGTCRRFSRAPDVISAVSSGGSSPTDLGAALADDLDRLDAAAAGRAAVRPSCRPRREA